VQEDIQKIVSYVAFEMKRYILLCVELNWIYWQTANEGRPRPEEIIGNV